MEEKNEDRFVNYLLSKSDDRAVLAALRSGLGRKAGTAPRMYPYVAGYLRSVSLEGTDLIAMFITASLFGKNPHHESGTGFGRALWKSSKSDSNPTGKHSFENVERRFTLALDAHPDDLQRYLEDLMGLCETAGVGVDWFKIRSDLRTLYGDKEEWQDQVRIRWARDFWGGPQGAENIG